VNTNTRNARVVICLILAMTAGARILLWLEPTPIISARATPLTAQAGVPIEEILIEYVQPGDGVVGPACLIMPDGNCSFEQGGSSVRLVVMGTEQGSLPEEQKQSLLGILYSIACGRGSRTPAIHLDANSDARVSPGVPAQARELCDMLVAKRFLD
jgi:hypothetical protein